MDPTLFNPLETDNEFIRNYRESLKAAYDAGVEQLNNQRNLDRSTIVNQANKAGVLFSNIPQRMQTQYDTQTYMPALTKLQNSYQTGLDSLRANSLNAINQMRYYQEMINHYNTMPTGNNTTSGTDAISNALKEALGNTSMSDSVANTVVNSVGTVAGLFPKQ